MNCWIRWHMVDVGSPMIMMDIGQTDLVELYFNP